MFKFRTVDYLPEEKIDLPDKLWPFMWYFAGQFKKQLFLIALLLGTSNFFVASIPYIVKVTVDRFSLIKDPAMAWDLLFWPVVIFIAIICLIQPAAQLAGEWIQARTTAVFTNTMRRQLALYMHDHSYAYFQDDFAGRLASKVIETPAAVREIIAAFLNPIGFASISFIVTIILFMGAHWTVSLLLLTWVCAYATIQFIFIPIIVERSQEGSEERSILRGRYVDILSNVLLVKVFARRKHEDKYLLESVRRTSDNFIKMDMAAFRLNVWMEIITVPLWAGMIILCVVGWQKQWLTAGDVAMLLPLTLQLTNIAWWISTIMRLTLERVGEVKEGMEAITKAHEVLDKPNARPLTISKGEIIFDNVDFAYGDINVFKDLNLKIKSGQKLGIIGSSGVGKSTLVSLLLRMFDIQGGDITIDGQNVASVQQDSLRSQITMIPQSSDLLHRSIRDNIRYGKLDATEDEIKAAAKRAYADDFIPRLEDKDGRTGYDAFVGERGVKLSGGQRQRIAIARAILKNAPILVLDEATSALDSESEQCIQESLKDLMKDKTVIAIAHRLSTIAHLDRLIVMHEGQIVEDGTHDELLAQNGHYAKLWKMQSGGFLGKAV